MMPLFVETTNITITQPKPWDFPVRTYDPVGDLVLDTIAPGTAGHLVLNHDDPRLLKVRAAHAMGLPLWLALPGGRGPEVAFRINGVSGGSGEIHVYLEAL